MIIPITAAHLNHNKRDICYILYKVVVVFIAWYAYSSIKLGEGAFMTVLFFILEKSNCMSCDVYSLGYWVL